VTVISPLLDGNESFTQPGDTAFEDGRYRLVYLPNARPTRFGTSAVGLREALIPLLPDADLVDIHSFLSPITSTAAKCALATATPYVIHPHGKLTRNVLQHRGIAKRIYLALRGRRLLRRAAAVITSAPNVAADIREWYPSINAISCTNGIAADELIKPAGDPPIDHPYVLYLGWLDPRKNLDLLIRAFAAAIKDRPSWRLALVGPDNYDQTQTLRQVMQQCNVSDKVLMPGPAYGDDKLRWLHHAQMFAMPSSGEGLSLSMVEALGCGLPCLLSPGCNYPQIESSGAGRELPLDVDAWADAISALMDDDEQRQRSSTAALKLFHDHHELKIVGQTFESRLADILASKA